jgi:hypothetical protein
VREDECDPVLSRTNPAELCADDVVGGGVPLPEPMQRFYEEQQRVRLPVVA